MPIDRQTIEGSERVAPAAERVGVPDPDQKAEVSLYLKRSKAQPGTLPVCGRDVLREERARDTTAAARIAAFAREHRLTPVEHDPARRLIRLSGRIEDLESAFGTELHLFQHANGSFRGRSGPLSAPADVANVVEAVLGLDQRPIANPKSIRISASTATNAHLPNAVARLYDFPVAGAGEGQCIAIIELGGGVSDSDTVAAFKAMDLAPPQVIAVPVDEGANQPGRDEDADGEVALDIQVAGGAAPRATLAVYFATNTDQGFVDAITQAVHRYRQQAERDVHQLGFRRGRLDGAGRHGHDLRLSGRRRSGPFRSSQPLEDGLATDGASDGKAHVDFPASSPWVIGCGGTSLRTSGAKLEGESVWNSNGGGTGGGISMLFSRSELPRSCEAAAVRQRGRQRRPGRAGTFHLTPILTRATKSS